MYQSICLLRYYDLFIGLTAAEVKAGAALPRAHAWSRFTGHQNHVHPGALALLSSGKQIAREGIA
jgi:hypothetical protein